MRRALVIPVALVGLLALTPAANAAFGLLRPEVTFEVKDGGEETQAGSHPSALTTAQPTGGLPAFSPPTGGVSPLPSGGIGADGFEGPGRCRRGTHEIRRKGRVRCVKDKQAKAGKAGKNRGQGR